MTGLHDTVVEAAGRGDTGAVETVYRTLAPRVLGYLKARGVDDPEGLTNEVFVAVLPRMPDVRGGAAGLRTLVFSIAHARAVDDHRRRSRAPVLSLYEPELDTRQVDSAEAEAMATVTTAELGQLLDSLGEDQRAVVMLRVLGDLSLEETAGVLGKSVGSVKQLQRRGLLRLRELMSESERRGS
ncbi:RNA polymerase sigma factor [Nocardioides pakistanensis]